MGEPIASSFAAQSALVTGASGGIGSAIAEALARRGASVGLVGRRRGSLERLAERIGAEASIVLCADLTSDRELEGAIKDFLRRARGLDVLVHSSGIHLGAPFEDAQVADFDRLWATNVRAPFLLTQGLLPALRSASGQVVFVSSTAALEPRTGDGQYAATHHALRALANTLRGEVNEAGVRVITVYPGRVATRMQERIFEEEGRPYEPARLLQPADVADIVVEALSLPRSAEVTDIRIRPMLKP